MSEEELIKKAKNEYMKNYRKTHKDKISEINKKYWLKKISNKIK